MITKQTHCLQDTKDIIQLLYIQMCPIQLASHQRTIKNHNLFRWSTLFFFNHIVFGKQAGSPRNNWLSQYPAELQKLPAVIIKEKMNFERNRRLCMLLQSLIECGE